MMLSVIIPAHNEQDCIQDTVEDLAAVLSDEKIHHEIVVINDNSTDDTEAMVLEMASRLPTVRLVNNLPPHGFGFAVRRGLECYRGDAVAIYMADASDNPKDLVRFWEKLNEGYDCVYGTRWRRGGYVEDYPWVKRILNRLANTFIQVCLQMRYDDTTNAFKLYRRHVIEGLQPLLSHHFNLTVELPLKAIVRGYSYAVLPNSWINRKTGLSKLKIKEMGSRYLFILLYVLLEKMFSCKDYHSSRPQPFTVVRNDAFRDDAFRDAPQLAATGKSALGK